MAVEASPKKKGPGRDPMIDPHLVVTTADTYHAQLANAWPILGKKLLAAETAVALWEVVKSGGGIISPTVDFTFSERMFEIIKGPKFPRVRTKSQIHHLADSLGGCGLVTPRRAREICAAQRGKKQYVITRRDFFIECTCGYEGPALHGACPKCGTFELSEELKQREEYES